jgi:SAM-dependent methyltransferase
MISRTNTDVTPADIYNHLILAHVILFFNKCQLFPDFAAGISASRLAEQHQFEPRRLEVVLRTAAVMGLLSLEDGRYHLTDLGHAVERNRGFFTWAIGGYSPLLESMDVFLAAPKTGWRPYVRGDYVAVGSDEANQGLMQPIFDRVIDQLPARVVADLGCGNAGRLVDLLRRRPELSAVGIDIDARAIAVAQKNRDQHHLQHRLQLVRENVFTALDAPPPELARVELVMSFMMLHDLFNFDSLRDGRLFSHLKTAFPRAKYFVLADTCLDDQDRTATTMPIFTLGYELIHALRGIQLFAVDHYERQFAASGLKLVARHEFGVPNTYLFVLEA